ncbi:MAG: hypothetical protein WCF24_01830 [Acidimicrobiales bacterium]
MRCSRGRRCARRSSPRRLVILGADLSRGLSIAALTELVAAHALTVVELVVISVVVGDAFFYRS